MRKGSVAVVGAAESTRMGVVPDLSQLGLNADAALNAIKDAGLRLSDIDGVATAGESPIRLAHYLGITPRWIDGTGIGGCSFLMHLRHAAAAINEGLCETVLIAHGESGRSRIAATPPPLYEAGSLEGQFEIPFGTVWAPTLFTLPLLRYMKTYGVTEEQVAQIPVIQRQWAAMNPRATLKDPISTADVLASRMIAYPFRLLMCCLVSDAGGAIVLTSGDRAKDFARPVYVLGTGESSEAALISQMEDYTTSRAFRMSGAAAFREAGITHADVDHLMIYDAFAHLPLYGLEDLGFCKRGEAADFIADGHTAPGGRLPTNTNGGGLSYMHSGMYGMFVLQESIRQMRGIAPAQVPGAKISVAHGVAGWFSGSSTIIFGNEAP